MVVAEAVPAEPSPRAASDRGATEPLDLPPVERAQRALDRFNAGCRDEALALALSLLEHPALGAEMAHLAAACQHQQGRSAEAVPLLMRAIRLDPANASYLNTFGVILRKLKRTQQAVRCYQRALVLQPLFPDCHYNCGNALQDLDSTAEACHHYDLCIQQNPQHYSAHHNWANILRDDHALDQALALYSRSAELHWDNPDMHCNWGLTWQLKEEWGKAIDCFQTCINLKADHAPAHINLGSALAVQERFEESCEILRRGVELDDSCHDAKFNLGLTLLTIGELKEGFGFYETRLSLPDKVKPPYTTPPWDGDLGIDGPLMVWSEQGYGDNIQFARYLPILVEAGLQVTYATRKPLVPLFRECLAPHSPAIVEQKRENLEGYHHHIAVMSLPKVLGTRLETIPMMPGYLKAPDPIPERLRIHRRPFALHVGLVWASGADNKDMYAHKSMALEPLMALFDRWRQDRLVVIHSLQVGVDAEQLEPWRGQRGVVDHAQDLHDFLDTACVLSQLDLVVTVDTAVAHVAGGLGRPTWCLLQHNADWRWLRGRADSPWYPSMSLFRQRRLGDWPSVVEQMGARLGQLLG